MNSILVIDIGTTNCKAITFDTNLKAIHSIKKGYQTITDDCGKSEQNPNEVFNVVIQLIEQSLKGNSTIKAVSFSAAMHSLIAMSKEGKPLTNAILWSDIRATEQAEQLKGTEAGKRIYERTGTPIHPMSPLCKIMWLKQAMPEVFAKTEKFISIKEYIFYQLFNKYIIDESIASATGLFDVRNKNWCHEALQQAGITTDRLSQPVEATHSETNLIPFYQQLFSSHPNLSFIVGGNDGCLANLGSGVMKPGHASLTIGTSGAIRMTTNTFQTDSNQRTFTYLLTNDIYMTGGAINNGGITLEWLSKMITTDDTPKEPDAVLRLAEEAPAGSDKLLFLPYLLGERAPMWDANAKGVLFGLTQQHTKAHMARAAMEGICFAMRDVMVAIESTSGTIRTIYASGGFTQSSFWLQMMADVLGKTIVINNSADASSVGAAIIALYASGEIDDLFRTSDLFSVQQTFYPDESVHQTYTILFPLFQSLYQKLKDSFIELNKLPSK